jgi:hypothetical protein
MGYFYSPGGGGGVQAPTFTFDATYDAGDTDFSLQLANGSATAPMAVELAFSPASNMRAVDPDSGTASSPSYALDPNETRIVKLERDTSAPDSGASQAISVVALMPDESTQTLGVTLEGCDRVKAAVRNFVGTPFAEHTFTGLVNTGTRGSKWDLTLQNSMATTSNVLNGTEGYVSTGAASNKYCEATISRRDIAFADTDKSYVYVWEHSAAVSSTVGWLLGPSAGFASHSELYLRFASGDWTSNSNVRTGGKMSFIFDTGHSHTSGGSSEALSVASGAVCLLVTSYNATTKVITSRWKCSDDSTSGHSFRDSAAITASTTDTSDQTVRVAGWSASTCPMNYRYFALVDGQTDATAMAQIMKAMGI